MLNVGLEKNLENWRKFKMREKTWAGAMFFSEQHGNIIRFDPGVHLDFGLLHSSWSFFVLFLNFLCLFLNLNPQYSSLTSIQGMDCAKISQMSIWGWHDENTFTNTNYNRKKKPKKILPLYYSIYTNHLDICGLGKSASDADGWWESLFLMRIPRRWFLKDCDSLEMRLLGMPPRWRW